MKTTLSTTRDALLWGAMALLLLGPVAGLVLTGYEVAPNWQRPLMLAAGFFMLRWLFLQAQHLLAGRAPLPKIAVHLPGSPLHHGLILLGLAFVLPFLLSKYWIGVAILALIYVLLGLGLNIVVGLAGLLDLGFVAFYAVGAYTYALGHEYLGLSFWTALPCGALLAGCCGALLGFPVLRMHGDYLAIVTLGFGEIIRLILNNWMSFTGGPNGVQAPFPALFGLEFSRRASEGHVTFHEFFGLEFSNTYRFIFIYLLLLAVVAFLVFFVSRLRFLPLGRAWEALREDEIACRSLGINHVSIKLAAFSLGATVGGIGGVFFAASQGFVNPTSFTFFESVLILAIVVLGGMGSVPGVIIAAIVITVLPELLRDFAEWRILLFGIAMVLMMIWKPRGLLRLKRPRFDLPLPKERHHAPDG
ncbi:MAG: high-affinity branched-chain amino acid ABC transporter permease LivM [Magnetococcales bacterium]|nr:high-affinity branched-chain amino acid ABC transporter permease LivM [Magnetococcales bacterium]